MSAKVEKRRDATLIFVALSFFFLKGEEAPVSADSTDLAALGVTPLTSPNGKAGRSPKQVRKNCALF